jgi:hypothetical protein
MNKRVLSAVLMLTLGNLASAKQIDIEGHDQNQVKDSCKGKGDTYWPKTGDDTTYGCMHNDGSGIVCGGYNDKYKGSCDTFMKVPKRLVHDLRTRAAKRE